VIDMRIKSMFFDRTVVKQAVDHAKRKVLSKAGAFIRQTARHSIRKRWGSSKPGNPPHSHEGSLRRLILFGYDRAAESVVVGPLKFRNTGAPQTLEFGGRTTLIRRRGGKVVRAKPRIAARPYMGPALEKEAPKLPALWRNSIRRDGRGS
jgi:hypothetical protein